MKTYMEITEARLVLELPEKASQQEIRDNYRRLIRKWHPDTCREDGGKCTEMTAAINAAYELITAYCSRYRISFAEDEVNQYISDAEWWLNRFGNDPLWGKP